MSSIWRGKLRTKIIFWVFVPTAIILLAVAWVIFAAYQQVTEEAAIERNHALTTLAAVEYKTNLSPYTDLLREYTALLAEPEILEEANMDALQEILSASRGRFELFDGGILVFNNRGVVVGAEPARADALGQNWSTQSYFRKMLRSPQEAYSNALLDGEDGEEVVVVSVPILGRQGQFLGLIAGLLRVENAQGNSLAQGASQLEGGGEVTYLVDGNGRVLYHPDSARIGLDISDYDVVQRLQAGQSDAVRTHSEDDQDIVASFAPVPDTPWSLISEQSWDTLISTNRRYATFFIILLILGIILPAIVVAFGSRQITRPIDQLNKGAQRVAQGEFGAVVSVDANDEIGELANQFNHMSLQLQESYASLEKRLQEKIDMEAVLRESETRYRTLFEESPVSLWEEDYSGVKKHIERLWAEGITDFRTYFRTHPEVVTECAAEIKIIDVNRAAVELLQYEKKEELLVTLNQISNEHSYRTLQEELIALAEEDMPFIMEASGMTAHGEPINFALHMVIVPGHQETWDRVFISLTDITQRVQVENDLRRHQEHLEELVAARTTELTASNKYLAQEIKERVHTEVALQENLKRTNTLYQVSRSLITVENLSDLLQSVVDRMADALPADRIVLFLLDHEAEVVTHAVSGGAGQEHVFSPNYAELQEGLTGWVLREREPTLSPKNVPDPRESELVQQRRIDTNCGSIIVAPLQYGSRLLGTITAINTPEDADFTEKDMDLVMAMANQTAVAIENARLYEETAIRAQEISILYNVGQKTAATLDMPTILNTIVEATVQVVRADKSLLLLVDTNEGKLLEAVGQGFTHEELRRQSYIEFQDGISGWVLREKESTLSDDIQTDARNQGIALINARRSSDKSVAVAPIMIGAEVVGTLAAVNGRHRVSFAVADLNLVTILARQAAAAIHNARLYEAAQEADRIKSAFLASMSHELRTPLNSIIGFTGIILQGLAGPLNDEQAKQMRMVQGSARHLLALINDVLDISKIEAGQIRVEKSKFEVRTAVNNVIHIVTPLAEKKSLPLQVTIDPKVGEIVSDQRRVEQILLNLVNNAIKFTDEGQVSVVCKVDGDYLIVNVADSGMGIKPESQHLLFKPFQQVKTGLDRQHEGTGLGLSISKRLVEILGGNIWLESEWGIGSTFSFSLPLKNDLG